MAVNDGGKCFVLNSIASGMWVLRDAKMLIGRMYIQHAEEPMAKTLRQRFFFIMLRLEQDGGKWFWSCRFGTVGPDFDVTGIPAFQGSSLSMTMFVRWFVVRSSGLSS
jgi:hypothetical protein